LWTWDFIIAIFPYLFNYFKLFRNSGGPKAKSPAQRPQTVDDNSEYFGEDDPNLSWLLHAQGASDSGQKTDREGDFLPNWDESTNKKTQSEQLAGAQAAESARATARRFFGNKTTSGHHTCVKGSYW
jgi:hypothetical protein